MRSNSCTATVIKGWTTDALNVTLVEAGERILPALPPRISTRGAQELTKLGVRVSDANHGHQRR